MNARANLWAYVDALCPQERKPADVVRLSAQREYPRVMIWKNSEMVASGGLEQISVYDWPMTRILYRPRRGKWTVTYFWADGAWSSVCLEDEDEFRSWTNGPGLPTPEAL